MASIFESYEGEIKDAFRQFDQIVQQFSNLSTANCLHYVYFIKLTEYRSETSGIRQVGETVVIDRE
ncbi:hypothetical protein PPL_00397 [Heterostelium album PN500]|uniref:Uncharacterized protein n=1 Tax=Heterostelium pallidum (strain ATCC 26659 / Pp 5 / PN500) TaxID=670386 RepID=D3AWC3_HETP5|nr:hypothetical protein PPL_00397 [Heterostelium album PN500]EFA86596.1 hypothetical protein PPL_00397 [Heterostelium album PN500]|eukprot:XP_020438701.1 hypothetical protein PPL_00397 [Heterostelium album PN500]